MQTIREALLGEKADRRKLDMLVRQGMMSPASLPMLHRGLDKLQAGKTLNPMERDAVAKVVDSLMYIVTGDDTVFQKARQHTQRTKYQTESKEEYDNEGKMAKTQLTTLADAAQELMGMLGDDQNLPEWVQSKITKAVDYLDTARDYMKSEVDEGKIAEALDISIDEVASDKWRNDMAHDIAKKNPKTHGDALHHMRNHPTIKRLAKNNIHPMRRADFNNEIHSTIDKIHKSKGRPFMKPGGPTKESVGEEIEENRAAFSGAADRNKMLGKLQKAGKTASEIGDPKKRAAAKAALPKIQKRLDYGMKEESPAPDNLDSSYKAKFAAMLKKTGKSLAQMSDEEKKKFFNSVDAAHTAKNEESVDEGAMKRMATQQQTGEKGSGLETFKKKPAAKDTMVASPKTQRVKMTTAKAAKKMVAKGAVYAEDARSDARRAMRSDSKGMAPLKRPGATKAHTGTKAGDEKHGGHIVMQLRKAVSISKPVRFKDGSTKPVSKAHAHKFLSKYNAGKPAEKEAMHGAHDSHDAFMKHINK